MTVRRRTVLAAAASAAALHSIPSPAGDRPAAAPAPTTSPRSTLFGLPLPGSYVDVTADDGVRLNAFDTGPADGPTVLLVHGVCQSHLSYAGQIWPLHRAGIRVVVPDLRGHGASDKPTAPGAYSPDQLAGDVATIIDRLRLDRLTVVGHSLGGLIVGQAVGNPAVANRTAGLVLIDTAATSAAFLIPTSPVVQLGSSLTKDPSPTPVLQLIAGITGKPLNPAEQLLLLGGDIICPPDVRAALFASTWDNTSALRRWSGPALIAYGDKDPTLDPGARPQLADLLPRASHALFHGSGHSPFQTDVGPFNHVLTAFVQQTAALTP